MVFGKMNKVYQSLLMTLRRVRNFECPAMLNFTYMASPERSAPPSPTPNPPHSSSAEYVNEGDLHHDLVESNPTEEYFHGECNEEDFVHGDSSTESEANSYDSFLGGGHEE